MISRVAYLSMHTSPLLQPGMGDAGGMNVYIHELAVTMAERGIAVDVFTRRAGPDDPSEVEVVEGYRVVHVPAGPAQSLPIGAMTDFVPEFAEGVLKWTYANAAVYDLVHSHYWLSGWAGVLVKEVLDLPLANSFHTLGRIKDLHRRHDEPPSSSTRLLTEMEVIARSACVIASTPLEAEELIDHYDASPERLCVSPPGVDHRIFKPGDRKAARRWLGLGGGPLLLFVGRIQPLKGLDVAVDTLRHLGSEHAHAVLVAVGGPSGPSGAAERDRIARFVAAHRLEERVHLVTPQPHDQLADFYRAADVLLVPSRSESFGLVAAEAQACGLPVVAAKVGGLPHVIADGVSGLLVEGWDPRDHAAAVQRILGDDELAARLSSGAVAYAERFSWGATADRFLELYEGITSA